MVDGLNIKVSMNKKRSLFLIFLLLLLVPGLITLAFSQDVEGLTDDLSGEVYPIGMVKEGMDFTETVSKTEVVLDKIEKVEKEKGKVYYDKIKTITPKDSGNQYCFVKVIIKQTDNTIVKEEILECADGRKKATGPSYWELFAEFYYRDISAPEYCRHFSRPNHIFKSYGKTCLKTNGEWEVQ
jgi:hypothetical protein